MKNSRFFAFLFIFYFFSSLNQNLYSPSHVQLVVRWEVRRGGVGVAFPLLLLM